MLVHRALLRVPPTLRRAPADRRLLSTSVASLLRPRAGSRLTNTSGGLLARPLPTALVTATVGGCVLALITARPAAAPTECAKVATEPVVEEPPSYTPSTGLRLLSKLLWRCAELLFFLGPVLSWYFLQQLPLLGRAFSRQRLLSLLIGKHRSVFYVSLTISPKCRHL